MAQDLTAPLFWSLHWAGKHRGECSRANPHDWKAEGMRAESGPTDPCSDLFQGSSIYVLQAPNSISLEIRTPKYGPLKPLKHIITTICISEEEAEFILQISKTSALTRQIWGTLGIWLTDQSKVNVNTEKVSS